MMPSGQAPSPERDPGTLLRARGLRVTPQRRAILGAFSGAATEHLSADEVHARASAVVPEISRGTVYAALAELTELGLLAAFGSPEPVRYEANATDHQHFRCRLCLRLYDVELPAVRTDRVAAAGFVVERSVTTVEGVCAECVQYASGLEAGVHAATTSPTDLPAGLACAVVESPLGDVLLGATADGLARAVFADHADAPALREQASRRRGGQAARRHLAAATAYVGAYFAGEPVAPGAVAVDWDAAGSVGLPTLRAIQAIRPGEDRSYETLRDAPDADAHERGLAAGTNPLVLVVPCHRLTRGREIPDAYVGGPERKRWLREHERR